MDIITLFDRFSAHNRSGSARRWGFLLLLAVTFGCLMLAGLGRAATLTATKEGIGIDAGAFGRFVLSVEKRDGQWLLVDPEGNACFHLGICGFQPGDDYTYLKGRTEQYEWLPTYESEYKAAFHPDPYWSRDTFSFYIANLIRKYGSYSPEDLQRRMIHRVRQVGFNAVGAFSGWTMSRRLRIFLASFRARRAVSRPNMNWCRCFRQNTRPSRSSTPHGTQRLRASMPWRIPRFR